MKEDFGKWQNGVQIYAEALEKENNDLKGKNENLNETLNRLRCNDIENDRIAELETSLLNSEKQLAQSLDKMDRMDAQIKEFQRYYYIYLKTCLRKKLLNFKL